MPWPDEPRCRFVIGLDSWTIHATGVQRREACARAGHGFVACFCGARIRLPDRPPVRVVGGWHHYCPECLCFLIAANDRPLASPLNTYEPWLTELARLEVDEPDTEEPDASWPGRDTGPESPRGARGNEGHMWVTSVHESRWHAHPPRRAVGARPTGLCGHTCRRGPFHGRIAAHPPCERGRSPCEPCLHALGYLPPSAGFRQNRPASR
ncbi:hypothetical protein [Actinopolyspora mortivallis]|uniref:hypothetical protein n=1 Tax=Actinopolyspora mortivallis TaxID=33906 RepID=UPI0021597DCB|nr:hypothetical protein [Actinopolyspora mortivallis]